MKGEKNVPNEEKPRALSIPNDVRTVVFDLDGTLYDKLGLNIRMVLCLWWCLPLLILDRCTKGTLWRWIVGTRWHRRVFLPTMVWLIDRHYSVRPEALQLLHLCRKRGLQTAVYSDYSMVREKLDALYIDANQFDLLVSSLELGDKKPSKACVEKVLQRLNATPETTLFVGDREEKDGESARRVGARFLKI